MRILWHSVAPWIKTGYGSQTEIFTTRIQELLGHDVAISSWCSIGGMTAYNDLPVYPKKADNFGNDIIKEHARHWNADLVITLADQWVFDAKVMKDLPWLAWSPIDHDPMPPKVKNVLQQGYAVPVAYSQFGLNKMLEQGLNGLYVPHAVHQDYLKDIAKIDARKKLNLPKDAFIIGMVGVNQSVPNRKSYPLALQAFAEFRKTHKDAFLYMHTQASSSEGVDQRPLIEHLELPEDSYLFADEYESLLGLSELEMCHLYSSFDVFLTPNIGEGFGIPLIEAQATGCPVIATNWTTMPELCFFGELIDGQLVYTNQSSFQKVPELEQITCALEKVYNYSDEEMKTGRAHAKAMIRQHYHPDIVTRDLWSCVLEQALDRIGIWKY